MASEAEEEPDNEREQNNASVEASIKKKKGRRRRSDPLVWSTHLRRIAQNMDKNTSVASSSIRLMEPLMDIFVDHLVMESFAFAKNVDRKKTASAKHSKAATLALLPAALSGRATTFADERVQQFIESQA